MTLYKVEKGCILCKGEVIGNKKQGYLCKHCNIKYSEKNLEGQEKLKYDGFDPEKHKKKMEKHEEDFKKRQNKYHPPKGSGWHKTVI